MARATLTGIPASLVIFLITLVCSIAFVAVVVMALKSDLPPAAVVGVGPFFFFTLASTGVYAGAREKFSPGKRTRQNRVGLVGNLCLLAFYLLFIVITICVAGKT
jgi:hypothetical protein